MTLDTLIKENEGLIFKIASSFYGVEKDDLYQAGVLGILKAYQNYEKNEHTKFSSYAYNYIYGEMYMLAHNKTLKINKDILKLYHNIEKTRYALAQRLGRVPSNSEVAAFLEMSEKDIDDAIMAGRDIMSLDSGEDTNLYDNLRCEEKVDLDDQILLKESMEKLNDDEKKIIKARYFEDLTQSEVAKKLCMTQVMVSRYEKKSLDKMCAFLSK